MKQIVIKSPGGLSNLNIVEKVEPKPGPREVLVQWHASSLNFHDYLVATGGIPVMDGRIPMSDGAGEIITVGPDVNNFKPGDKVMSLFFPGWKEGSPSFQKIVGVSGETLDGYMCEMSCIHEEHLTRIPSSYSFAEAATLPCAGLTAWNALFNTAGIKAGDSILVQGTGGLSLFGLQFAKAAGAEVIATTSSESKAEKLKELACSAVVNYRDDSNWGKSIFRMTGSGVDHILDVGGGSTIYNSIEAARIGGTIVSLGILGNGRKGEITFPKLFFKFLNLKGMAVGSREMQEQMIRTIESNNIHPIIDRIFKFDELAEAFRYQESGQHFGKIVLEW